MPQTSCVAKIIDQPNYIHLENISPSILNRDIQSEDLIDKVAQQSE